MSQQKSKSNSILLQVYSGLLKGRGCLLLAFIGCFTLFVMPSIFVEILWSPTSWLVKVKQAEGKHHVSSMNRAQQAYFADKGAFSTSIEALEIGIETETNNYKYSIRVTKIAAFSYAVAKNQRFKSYFGGVFIVPAQELDRNADRDEMTTVSILCETEKRPFFRVKRTDEPDEPAEPIYQNGQVICGKGTTELTR
ncbi:type IV pilin-like G/H family protein [Microcoleus sp. F10-C6]|uniref:type IV pilin-like G/H family protein n=1 Tax=unclassified Microcoleus TaxID=2642155 RepID=UPI002FD5E16B